MGSGLFPAMDSGGGNFQFGPSEANAVIGRFKSLGDSDKQHLLNFLRSL